MAINITGFNFALLNETPMSEKDYKLLMELFKRKLEEPATKEEALRSLMNAGIVDADWNFTEPYQHLASIVTKA